jgi:MFS transporter, DHA1 family, multidrug resistance protein
MLSSAWAARLIVFVAFLDLFSQFPIVAPHARELGADPAMISVAVNAYDVTNLVGNLVAPFLLALWGRKLPLVAGLAVAALCQVAYGFIALPGQFALVRGVHGLAQAILSPGAFLVLSESVAPGRRAQAMGSAGVFIAIAAVLGPFISGITASRMGANAVFFSVAALLGLVALVVAFLSKPDDMPAEAEPDGERRVTWGTLVALVQRPALLGAYAAALTWTAGIGTLVVHLPLQLGDARLRGYAYGVYAVVALVLFAGPAPWLANRFGRLRPTAAGLALIGLSLCALAATVPATSGVYGSMALFGVGFGLLFPAVTALVADASTPHERGAAYGVFCLARRLRRRSWSLACWRW